MVLYRRRKLEKSAKFILRLNVFMVIKLTSAGRLFHVLITEKWSWVWTVFDLRGTRTPTAQMTTKKKRLSAQSLLENNGTFSVVDFKDVSKLILKVGLITMNLRAFLKPSSQKFVSLLGHAIGEHCTKVFLEPWPYCCCWACIYLYKPCD